MPSNQSAAVQADVVQPMCRPRAVHSACWSSFRRAGEGRISPSGFAAARLGLPPAAWASRRILSCSSSRSALTGLWCGPHFGQEMVSVQPSSDARGVSCEGRGLIRDPVSLLTGASACARPRPSAIPRQPSEAPAPRPRRLLGSWRPLPRAVPRPARWLKCRPRRLLQARPSSTRPPSRLACKSSRSVGV